MKYIIIFIFMLFLTQHLEGQESVIIQKHKDYYANSEAKVNTEKELPIFDFENKGVGDFIKKLGDTIAKIDMYEIVAIDSLHDYKTDIDDCDTCKNAYIYIHSDDLNEKNEDKAKGIVVLSNDEIAFLMKDNPEWLSKIGLYKTNNNFILKFGKYNILRRLSLREIDYRAVVQVIDKSKVEPIWIKKVATDINLTDDAIHFDWINNFYEN